MFLEKPGLVAAKDLLTFFEHNRPQRAAEPPDPQYRSLAFCVVKNLPTPPIVTCKVDGELWALSGWDLVTSLLMLSTGHFGVCQEGIIHSSFLEGEDLLPSHHLFSLGKFNRFWTVRGTDPSRKLESARDCLRFSVFPFYQLGDRDKEEANQIVKAFNLSFHKK